MNKVYSKLLCTTALLMGAFTTTQAQTSFTIEATDYANLNWNAKLNSISLTEVGAALGFDSGEAFAAELDASEEAYTAGNDPSIVISTTDANGETVSRQTDANYWLSSKGRYTYYGNFWLNSNGLQVPWSNDCCVWSTIQWDASTDEFKAGMGQYGWETHASAGNDYKSTSTLTYGDKSVDIHIVLHVIEEPKEDGPKYKELNIVGTDTLHFNQDYHLTGVWSSDNFSFDLSKALPAVGLTTDDLANDLASYLWTYRYDSEANYLGEELTQKVTVTTGAIGWWLTPSTNDDDSEGPCYTCKYGATDESFYLDYVTYADSTNSINGIIGQSYNGMAAGKKHTAELYLVNGDKAYKMVLILGINPKKTIQTADMEVVGQEDVNYIQPVRYDNNVWDTVTLNADSIATLLGAESKDQLQFMNVQPDTLCYDWYAATTQGFWLTGEGAVTESGSAKYFAFYEPSTGNLNVGQPAAGGAEGDVYTGTFALVYNDKMYKLNLKVDLPIRQRVDPSEFHNVATFNYKVQAIPANVWLTGRYTPTLSTDTLTQLLGNPLSTLYGEAVDTLGRDTVIYTMNYTATPYPGFWFTPQGKVSGYTGSLETAPFSFLWDGNKFQAVQIANANQVGEAYDVRMYLVGDGTGNMITFNIHLEFVDQIVEYEDAGSSDAPIEVTSTDDIITAFDADKIFTALGCTAEQFSASGKIEAYDGEGYGHADYNDEIEGFWFDADGVVLNPENIDSGLFSVKFIPAEESEDGVNQLRCYTYIIPEGNTIYTGKLCFCYGNKRYYVQVQLMNQDTYTGIGSTVLNNNSAKHLGVYDLAGRRINKDAKALQRGMYIVNGQKVLIQ